MVRLLTLLKHIAAGLWNMVAPNMVSCVGAVSETTNGGHNQFYSTLHQEASATSLTCLKTWCLVFGDNDMIQFGVLLSDVQWCGVCLCVHHQASTCSSTALT